MTPHDGRFDFTAVQRAAPKLLAADKVVKAQAARMAEIDLSGLLGPVRRQVSAVELQLNEVSAASATAARVAKVGPWLFDGKSRDVCSWPSTTTPRSGRLGVCQGRWAC